MAPLMGGAQVGWPTFPTPVPERKVGQPTVSVAGKLAGAEGAMLARASDPVDGPRLAGS